MSGLPQFPSKLVDMATRLIILLLLIATAHVQSCRHVSHAMACFRPILQTSEQMLEENEMLLLNGEVNQVWVLCKNYFSAQTCLENSIRRCGGLKYAARRNLDIYIESVIRRGVYRLCDDIELIHKFSKYGHYFHKTSNNTGACLKESKRQFRANGMSLHPSSLDELSWRHCGTMENLMTCGYRTVSGNCGHDPALLYLDLMRRLLPRRAVDVCMASYGQGDGASHGHGRLAMLSEIAPHAGAPAVQQFIVGVVGATVGMASILFAIFCMP